MSTINNIIQVPGSKSIANRALICAALADSSSTIENCAPGDDTEAMLTALRVLGVNIQIDSQTVRVGGQLNLSDKREVIVDAKLAGTTSRFLTALCTLRSGATVIDGGEPLRKRPMLGLHIALKTLGANVSALNEQGCLPVKVSHGSNLTAQISIDASFSSQFTSALMMIAPYMPDGLEISLDKNIVSRGYIEMTIGVMRAFGASADFSGNTVWVSPTKYLGTKYVIEPDASSASYPLGAMAISGGSLTVKNLFRTSLQSDVEFANLLAQMGCAVAQQSDGLSIARDGGSRLRGISVDMSQMSDCVPTLATVALFADSPTQIKGVGFIRAKESDRIGDLAKELRKLGAEIQETPDGMVITPRRLTGAHLETHHDHRLAMAFGLLRREIAGVEIANPEVVSKSWPNYFAELAQFYKQ